MIGMTAARYSTILHKLSTIKQQVRVTDSTLSLGPRENTGGIGAKAGDSTYNTTKVDCQFLHELDGVGERLGSYHNEGEERFENFVARTTADFVVQLGHLLKRCLCQGLQLGHVRDGGDWNFHNLEHVVNDQTTSSFDSSSLSLGCNHRKEDRWLHNLHERMQTANFSARSLKMDIDRPALTTKGTRAES